MLIDLQLARATTLSLRLPTDSAQLRWIEYKQSIFSKYKTDSSQFRQSFEFYAAHPYVFNKVAERMMVKLDEMEYKGQTKPVTP